MQKKEYILGEGGGEALHGGALGPEAAVEILVLFFASQRAARASLNRSRLRGYRSKVLGRVLIAMRAAATSLLHRCTEV
jgi:hypothetical protein